MKGGKGTNFLTLRLPVLLLALTVLATGIVVVAPSLATAQETVRRPWSLRDLFGTRRPERVEPKVVAPPQVKKKPVARKVEPQIPLVEKLPEARAVLVVGDFLGSGLADGLSEALAQNPRIRVVDRTNGSSGFVRDDVVDWPKKIVELIDAEKPAAVVVLIGANDRQQMRIGDAREAFGSTGWNTEYIARVEALAKTVTARKVPLLWVGVPAFKSPNMLTDMLVFNEIYRAAAVGAGAEFIDIWDGFVDENGLYVASGPDMNGQPVRLRANDGINLTRPGKRKVAFYVEKPLYKVLGETGATGVASLPASELPAGGMPEVDVGSIDRTMPVSLKDPALDGGTELLGLVPAPKRDARSPGEKLAVEGLAPEAAPGRADNFTWPQAAAEAQAFPTAGR